MKKNKELHTKDWTLNRIWGLLGLLAFEIFCVVWLILFEQQVIVSILFMAFAVGSMVMIIKLARNYKRKNFKTLLEKDIEEDMKYADKLGDAYYMWKAYTLPYIAKGEVPPEVKLDLKDKVIIERGIKIKELEERLRIINKTANKLLEDLGELYFKNKK